MTKARLRILVLFRTPYSVLVVLGFVFVSAIVSTACPILQPLPSVPSVPCHLRLPLEKRRQGPIQSGAMQHVRKKGPQIASPAAARHKTSRGH